MVSISVSIPTHNRSEYVTEAIESALDQTFSDLEIVVFNDGSTDDTRQVLSKYDNVDRVRIFHSEDNLGQGTAKKKAASKCKGDYIAFLDDDDLWHSKKLEKQFAKLEARSDEYCGVYCGLQQIRGEKIVNEKQRDKSGDLYPELLDGQPMPTSGTVVRRSHYDEVGGYDPSFDRMPDWDLFIRLSHNYKFGVVKEPLLIRRDHPGNMVKDPEHGVEGRKLIWKKHRKKYKDYPTKRERFFHICEKKKAYMYLQRNRRIEAFKSFAYVLKKEPSFKFGILLFISFLGKDAYKLLKSLKRFAQRITSA